MAAAGEEEEEEEEDTSTLGSRVAQKPVHF